MSLYNRILKNWHRNVTDEDALVKYLDNFQLIYSYNSGVMENDKITFDDTREIFENGKVISYTGDLKTLYEIKNLKDCIQMMIKDLSVKKPIDLDLIKRYHLSLTKNTYDESRYLKNQERPGEFKKHDYVTGINEVGAAPEDVEQELEELVAEIGGVSPEQALTAGAYFHLKFENIHPFADGNGRTGRALLNYFLLQSGHPPICIYNEDKKIYIEGLRHYDLTGDIKPMENFLKAQTEKTWQKTRSLVKEEGSW